jgi:hypothetical protein
MTVELDGKENKKIVECSPESVTPQTISIEETTKEGIQFILQHFVEPLWPRTVSTKLTDNRQVPVYNIDQTLDLYKKADYRDCRINAYPYHTEFKDINRQEPDFIFAGDLDASRFQLPQDLEAILKKTCKKIVKDIGGYPTVIWSGNGYHIYQPIISPLLELESQFARFDRPSTELLRYAENRFTNGKTDPCHNPTVKSCMVRVPGSINSKNGQQVQIIQRWNSVRPKINPILFDFYIYLASKKLVERQQQLKRKQRQLQLQKHQYHNKAKLFSGLRQQNNSVSNNNNNYSNNKATNMTSWIERLLLDKGLKDYRKYAITFILAPYFINVKNSTYGESFNAIQGWLSDKCMPLRPLDSPMRDFDRRIKDSLESCIKKGWKPPSLDKLKLRNKELYDEIMFSGNSQPG